MLNDLKCSKVDRWKSKISYFQLCPWRSKPEIHDRLTETDLIMEQVNESS